MERLTYSHSGNNRLVNVGRGGGGKGKKRSRLALPNGSK
jgi:hypothetical protein